MIIEKVAFLVICTSYCCIMNGACLAALTLVVNAMLYKLFVMVLNCCAFCIKGIPHMCVVKSYCVKG